MAHAFPLYIDLDGNNCVIIGGGQYAAQCAKTLKQFSAKVTVISPKLCSELHDMDKEQTIRYIPRKYSRGDCTNACLCIAATNVEATNISISVECKAKGIPVNLSKPSAFGNFAFPAVIFKDDVCISIAGKSAESIHTYCDKIEACLDA